MKQHLLFWILGIVGVCLLMGLLVLMFIYPMVVGILTVIFVGYCFGEFLRNIWNEYHKKG